MNILKDLRLFETHCQETDKPEAAELLYNTQETILVLLEDRTNLVTAAEDYIGALEDWLTATEPTIDKVTPACKALKQAIKEAKK